MIEKDIPILDILTYGNSILRKRAKEIRNIDSHIDNLALGMVKTMYAAPGIGLAAPQVNHSLRLITVDLSVGEKSQELIILINPEILSQEGESILEEACLSVPEISEKISRPYRILVKGMDLKGKEKTIEAEGLLARVFCHEIDHLNGKLLIDRLSPLKKNLLKKKLKELTIDTKSR